MCVSGHVLIEPRAARQTLDRNDPNSHVALVVKHGRRWPCGRRSTDGDSAGRGDIRSPGNCFRLR